MDNEEYIEQLCNDLKDALTDLANNDDNYDEYERVRYLVHQISGLSDNLAKE